MRIDDFLHMLENLFYAGLAAAMVFGLYRYFYRGLPRSDVMDYSLMPASIMASFLFYQFGSWPALTIILVVVFSLIHFRTVIYEPIDALFIFWALISGIFTGIGLEWYIVLFNLFVMLAGMLLIRWRQTRLPYLLLVRYDMRINQLLLQKLEPLNGSVKEQSVLDGISEIKLELAASSIDLILIEEITHMEGVHQAMMLRAEKWL